MSKRHCVVLAGGLGTRIREVTRGRVPKVLVEVLGRPFLYYKLHGLRDMGIEEVTLLVGELGDQVDDYISNHPIEGLTCKTIHDGPVLLGTGGSVARAASRLPETFWVTYGDSFVTADLAKAERTMDHHGVSALMTVLKNRDQLELSNTKVNGNLVTDYRKGAPAGTYEWIDYGLLLFRRETFDSLSSNQPTDLCDVLKGLIERRQLMAFEVTERFWDVGTPEALKATEIEFRARRSR
jgi:MurNAc alpha-1-phosphate uridylyltransferase